MIGLKDIIGHEELIKTLHGALQSGRISHAHLFSGPRGVGKKTTALAFARALLCLQRNTGDGCGECESCRKVEQEIHPDMRTIRPEGATIKISQVRQLMADLRLGSADGRWVVRIVDEADAMTAEAANAMLKTLEEPLQGVVIILVTTRPQAVLPTIVSRCQHMVFQPMLKHQVLQGMIRVEGEPSEKMQLAAAMSGGSLGKALELVAGGFIQRDLAFQLIERISTADVEEALSMAAELTARKEDLVSLLDMMILWFRDSLLYNETGNSLRMIYIDRQADVIALTGTYTTGRLLDIIQCLERSKSSLLSSANVQLALEALFLRLAGFGPEGNRREEVI